MQYYNIKPVLLPERLKNSGLRAMKATATVILSAFFFLFICSAFATQASAKEPPFISYFLYDVPAGFLTTASADAAQDIVTCA